MYQSTFVLKHVPKVFKKSKFCIPIISSDENKVEINKVLLYFKIMNEELSLF